MDSELEQIGKDIRRIVGKGDKPFVTFPVMSGKVVSMEDDNSCTVKLTGGDADTPLDGITMSVLLSNVLGMYGVPSVGADCLVAEVDGGGAWELLRASKYDKVVLRGDGLGGLVKVKETADKIKALEQKVNALNAAMKGIIIPLAPSGTYLFTADPNVSALADITPLTAQGDIENTNVKHG